MRYSYVIPSALAIMTEVVFFSVRSISKVVKRKQIGHIYCSARTICTPKNNSQADGCTATSTRKSRIHYSLFTIHYSLFTTIVFAIHYALFTDERQEGKGGLPFDLRSQREKRVEVTDEWKTCIVGAKPRVRICYHTRPRFEHSTDRPLH